MKKLGEEIYKKIEEQATTLKTEDLDALKAELAAAQT